MANFKTVYCPVCNTLMEQNTSKTQAHFKDNLNTIGVFVCPKCKCERIITTDDTEDED